MSNTASRALPSHWRPSRSSGNRLGFLLWLSLCSGLVACDMQEVESLRHFQRGLDLELAEKSEIAQNLNERRHELDVLRETLTSYCPPTSPEALRSRTEAQVPGARVSERKRSGSQTWLLVTGKGPASEVSRAVASLVRQSAFFSLEEVSAEKGSWTLVLRSDGPCPPAPAGKHTALSKSPLPPPGWFKTRETRQMRASIVQTQERIADLDKVIGEVVIINSQTDWAKKLLAANDERQNSLLRQAPLVEALFASPEAFSGALHLTGDRVTYEGPLPLAEPHWSTRLAQAGFQVSRGEGARWVLTRH